MIINFIFIICLVISAIAAINWMTTAYGINLVEKTTRLFKIENYIKIIYTVIGIAGCILLLMTLL